MKKTPNPVRIGVLGCGMISQAAHFESCQRARNARLYAICDAADDLRTRMTQMWEPEVAYTNTTLKRWVLAPVSFQLWFIRSLFFYNLLYPVLRWAVTKYPIITFSVLGFLWLSFFQAPMFEGQGLFFLQLVSGCRKRLIQ